MKIPKNNKNTNKILEKFKEEKLLQEIVIGKILGDGYINKSGYLNFCHSIKQKEYIEHCYDLFKDYTRSGIKLFKNKRKDKIHDILSFDTKAIFKDLMVIFYKYDEINKKRIKIIPLNIKDLITPASLAYWIMDDGYFNKPHIQICTHSFTYDEVNLLKDVLESKFLLKCKIQKEKIRDTGLFWYILEIRKESLNLLWELVGEYILPTMKYKFGK